MKKIISKVNKFNDERDWNQFHTPENLAKSIVIEAGELLECFQWNNNYKLEEVEDELADVFLYAIMMANQLNFDINQIINNKINRNELRYPAKEAKGSSKKYTEYDDEDN